MITIPLQLFGCGERGLETPVQYGATVIVIETSYVEDAMPLVEVPGGISLETVIAEYQGEFGNVDFQIGPVTRRELANLSGFVEFDEYWLTYASSQSQPVYALTTGHLFYLHDEKSFGSLLGGTKPNQGEAILILKPMDTARYNWRSSHPGRILLLEECAYLNVQMLNNDALKDLIKQSATEEYFKILYKEATKTEWLGSGDWVSEYVRMFVEYPHWPIIVNGGSQIATTGANPDALQEQRVAMFFRIGEQWQAHHDAVKTFFKYHQRSPRLSGHPLIARLLGHSVEAGTVDVIPFSEGDSLKRSKQKLVTDFELYLSWSDPAYHPLALEPDEDPHRLIVPSHSSDSMFPVPVLRPDQLLTRLKISNPLGLQINLGGNIPAGVSLSPTSFSATEQVVEVEVSWDLAPETAEAKIEITTGDGVVVHEIVLTFLEFRAIPVKFWKVSDENGAHVTDMGEPRLREAISYANDLLGRQANVYIYPTGESVGTILHDLRYSGDLGDRVSETNLIAVSEQISSSSEGKNINVLFVWNLVSEKHGNVLGATYPSLDHFKISVDTVDNADNLTLAATLVHELGHWFSSTFIWNTENGELPECSGRDKHFSHLQGIPPDVSGCPEGDWAFYDNLMAPGGRTMLITVEQARVFNEHADEVLP